MLKLGTVKQWSQLSGMRPPSRPEKPTVSMPISRAAWRARLMFADFPLVEMPSAMSPFRPSSRSCCTNARAKSWSLPTAVSRAVSVVSATAGRAGRFSMIGCMNSTATWAASQELPPLPMTNRRAPLSKALARAVQQAAMRSACSMKNCSLVAMLSRHLRRMRSRRSPGVAVVGIGELLQESGIRGQGSGVRD